MNESLMYAGKTYKYLDMCSNGFWSPKKALTYNRPIVVVTATRSVGKSTGVALYVLFDWLVNHHKFMYIRRRQRDTYKTCKTFFNNAIAIVNRFTPYHIIDFKFDKGFYWIATEYEIEKEEPEPIWEKCGMAFPLSEEEDLKSSVFSDYFTIIYDEFISKDRNKYLGTKNTPEREWESVTSLYQTVDRGIGKPFRNETRIFLLGNKATIYNPICISLGISAYVRKGQHFTSPKGKQWVWEDLDKVEATATIEESFAFQMSSESVKDYAYRNLGKDKDDFIKKPEIAMYITTVKLHGEMYGIYRDDKYNFYIWNAKPDYAVIALDVDSHDENMLQLINKWRDSPLMITLSNAYRRGMLYFGNGKIQNAFLLYLEFLQ